MLEKTRSRSRIKRSRQKTADERKHMDKVAGLGCLLCGAEPQLHHIRTGQGMGKRASHMDVIPLCLQHHTGDFGLHGLGRKAFERYYEITELELLEKVRVAISAGVVPL